MNIQQTARTIAGAGVIFAACAVPVETGPPIADPGVTAARLLRRSGPDEPSLVRFEWKYSDRRGSVEGDGAARFNPPDSLRLDLFTSGEVAMAVALAGRNLSSLGEIEDVEVPPGAFLFAMAGLFRPRGDEAPRGFEADGDTVLVYGEDTEKLYFFARAGRLVQVEERRHGSLRRKVELEWGEHEKWPTRAEFRDFDEHSRVRWTVGDTRIMEAPYSSDIFTLPNDRPSDGR
ncbi:MAG: hypothetical protein PVF05_09195 [Gemmatimonadales bacterium]